jgi:hypothetical protein
MGRQIRFFLCPPIRSAIESEATRVGAKLVRNHPSGSSAIQFSTSAGTDTHQGRLWTDAPDTAQYDALCRAVKRHSVYDREAGLWVKRESRAAFDTYRAETQKALAKLVEKNRKYAIEVLGGRVAHDEV